MSRVPRWRCACGAEAHLAADVFRPGGTTSARMLLCSPTCSTVLEPGTRLDIILEGNDFRIVMAARPCWCHHANVGQIVPFCPEHGPQQHR